MSMTVTNPSLFNDKNFDTLCSSYTKYTDDGKYYTTTLPFGIKKPLYSIIKPTNKKFTLIIKEALLDKIKYLCSHFPRNEWSGELFYKSKGDISNLENLVITAFDLYPLDLGSSAKTTYDHSNEVAGYIADNPELMDHHMGIIHSHNSMDVFFSGTDIDNLIEEAPLYKYYLSIVVNNRLDIIGKLVIFVEDYNSTTFYTGKYTGLDCKEKTLKMKESKEENKAIVIEFDADVKLESKVFSETFINSVKDLKTNIKKQSFKQDEYKSDSIVPLSPIKQNPMGYTYTSNEPKVTTSHGRYDIVGDAHSFIYKWLSQNLFYTPYSDDFIVNIAEIVKGLPEDISDEAYCELILEGLDNLLSLANIITDSEIVDLLGTAEGLLWEAMDNKTLSKGTLSVVSMAYNILSDYYKDVKESIEGPMEEDEDEPEVHVHAYTNYSNTF